MDLSEIKKDAINDLNAENERQARERIKDIVREISRLNNTITQSHTRIAELQKELRDMETVSEITTENIL